MQDVHEVTFSQYTIGDPLSADTYPEGVLLQQTGTETIYCYNGDYINPFPDTALFESYNYSLEDVVGITDISGFNMGSTITTPSECYPLSSAF